MSKAMRRQCRGFVHELTVANSAEDVVEAAVRCVLEGRQVGEPTILCATRTATGAVQDMVGASPDLTVVPRGPERPLPGRLLTMFRRLTDQVDGSSGVRIINEMPSVVYGDWHQWRRYEAAANLLLAELGALGLCIYDGRRLSGSMLDDLRTTHPLISSGGRHEANVAYKSPWAFGRTSFDMPADPVERSEPDVALTDPSLAAARAAVRGFADRYSALTHDAVEALVYAVNEALTNAMVHGRPPVGVRLWLREGRVVVSVSDTGPGPEDCFVGLLPSPHGDGMWLSHQLVDVAHHRNDNGYTVRLTATEGPLGPAPAQ